MFDSRFGILGIISLAILAANCNIVTNPKNSGPTQVNSLSASDVNNTSLRSVTHNQTTSESTEDSSANQLDLEQYWLNQRDIFFNLTTFNLSKVSHNCYLLGEYAEKLFMR